VPGEVPDYVPPAFVTVCSVGQGSADRCSFYTDEPIPPGAPCYCGQYNGIVPWSAACVSPYFGTEYCTVTSNAPIESGTPCNCGFNEGVTE
jgi:hypothetical protein